MRGVFELERLRASCPYVPVFGNRTAHLISAIAQRTRSVVGHRSALSLPLWQVFHQCRHGYDRADGDIEVAIEALVQLSGKSAF